ncbi:MAG: TetR family transcriptional regulator [Clostridiales bacterium]|nr:TetR family transcriptional regulator [Clostridiales bacterium]
MHDTKHAFGSAMHTLMAKIPFTRITVGDICEACGMSRKSFYYHFRDKYELLGWIFETEFVLPAKQATFSSLWDFVHALCEYLFANRAFYLNAFTVCGQNAFAEQFYLLLRPVAAPFFLPKYEANAGKSPFFESYYLDAFFCSLLRWLHASPILSPAEYVTALKDVATHTALNIECFT